MREDKKFNITYETVVHTDGKTYYVVRSNEAVGFIGSGETFIEAIENAYDNSKLLEEILNKNRRKANAT